MALKPPSTPTPYSLTISFALATAISQNGVTRLGRQLSFNSVTAPVTEDVSPPYTCK
jgi:hypothetical protein